MMNRNELLKHCRYFHNEDSSPFEDNSKQSIFWDIERQYIDNAERNPLFHDDWIKAAKKYITDNLNEDNTLTSNKISIETKGIILYIESMLMKWMPYNYDIIFDY